MIQLRHGGWATARDLSRPTMGLEDPPEMIESCLRVVSAESTGPVRSKARAANISIRRAELRGEVERRVRRADAGRRIADLEATVNRLLSFVPRRASPLSEERKEEVSRALADVVGDSFGDAWAMTNWSEEADLTSVASERVTVLVDVKDLDPEAFADAAFDFHGRVGALLSPEERRAVRVIVEPRSSNSTD